MPRTPKAPSYRRHKASGQAVVSLGGVDFYLGPYGTKISRDEYDRVVGEWLAAGRRLPGAGPDTGGVTVVELIDAFLAFAEKRYVKSGEPTSEVSSYEAAVRPLKRLYGRTDADSFGPLALRTVRDAMVALGWSRRVINRQTARVRHLFRWGVSRQLVRPDVLTGLEAVEPLHVGTTEASDPAPVGPVADAHVAAVKPFLSAVVWTMIRVQQLTGMRSGEVTAMRPCDINMGGKLWEYKPESHKTQHHGHERIVPLGPRAQSILRPFLTRDTTAYLFSASEADAQRRDRLHKQRVTPLSCGNKPGTCRKSRPARKPGERYDSGAYATAIKRACDIAFPPPEPLAKKKGETVEEWRARLTPEQKQELAAWRKAHRWHPHQLRHSFATKIRRQYGLEEARLLCGHRSATVTEIYAESDRTKASEIMAKIG